MSSSLSIPRPSILFIDKDIPLLDKFRKGFQDCGYDVYTAEDGDQGLWAYEEKKPDVTVIEAVLPSSSKDLNGFQVCRNIFDMNPKSIRLILTELQDEFTDLRYIDSRANAILRKPMEIEKLLKSVEDIRMNRLFSNYKLLFCVAFSVIFGFIALIGSGLFAMQYHYSTMNREYNQGAIDQLKKDIDAEQARRFDDWTKQVLKDRQANIHDIDELRSSLNGIWVDNRQIREALATHGLMNNLKLSGGK